MLFAVVVLAGLWWILTGGSVSSWLIGFPAVAGAAWAIGRLGGLSDTNISLVGLVRFVPFFLWESLRGGADVALRTLAPRMRIRPGFSRYRTGLRTVSARNFFANCVSVLPGTLTADLHDEWLEVHVLSTELDAKRELDRLERSVARLFSDPGGGL